MMGYIGQDADGSEIWAPDPPPHHPDQEAAESEAERAIVDCVECGDALFLIGTIGATTYWRCSCKIIETTNYGSERFVPITALSQERQLREEAERERDRHVEFAQQWYAERWERLRDLAEQHGFLSDAASIMANGGLLTDSPPTYAQQLNVAKHRAETAERERDELVDAIVEHIDALTQASKLEWGDDFDAAIDAARDKLASVSLLDSTPSSE